jgi:hypothetical protein
MFNIPTSSRGISPGFRAADVRIEASFWGEMVVTMCQLGVSFEV